MHLLLSVHFSCSSSLEGSAQLSTYTIIALMSSYIQLSAKRAKHWFQRDRCRLYKYCMYNCSFFAEQ